MDLLFPSKQNIVCPIHERMTGQPLQWSNLLIALHIFISTSRTKFKHFSSPKTIDKLESLFCHYSLSH